MCAERFSRRALISLYESHPCNAGNIRDRLGGKWQQAGLRARDLAEDGNGDRTDQNHVGGAAFVAELARASGVDANSHILDLGCGLGGSARLLASEYGCRVDGIDISPKRVQEGNMLTSAVGLELNVQLTCADLRHQAVKQDAYTHLWNQGAWVHITDKVGVLKRWLKALKPGGKVALEDSFLRTSPAALNLDKEWQRLCAIWMSQIPTMDEWFSVLEPECRVIETTDLTPALTSYYERLCALPLEPDEGIEREGWELAIMLARAGVLGYTRIIAEVPEKVVQ